MAGAMLELLQGCRTCERNGSLGQLEAAPQAEAPAAAPELPWGVSLEDVELHDAPSRLAVCQPLPKAKQQWPLVRHPLEESIAQLFSVDAAARFPDEPEQQSSHFRAWAITEASSMESLPLGSLAIPTAASLPAWGSGARCEAPAPSLGTPVALTQQPGTLSLCGPYSRGDAAAAAAVPCPLLPPPRREAEVQTSLSFPLPTAASAPEDEEDRRRAALEGCRKAAAADLFMPGPGFACPTPGCTRPLSHEGPCLGLVELKPGRCCGGKATEAAAQAVPLSEPSTALPSESSIGTSVCVMPEETEANFQQVKAFVESLRVVEDASCECEAAAVGR